ncbi:MAG: sigma-70 family RNA polymerase sigma factor [Gemmataceae bacterium]|nr:sigma-70 family RNA polymerase sigma factor [Gemmataceae bacterium]MDW8242001.1 sigma-70 family RNA polymerase sigma factor [Thermogemmata sp.]
MPAGQTSNLMALRDPDIRLMLRVRDDDPTAFAELVQRFQHRLIAVLHHLVGDRDEAEDLAQEVFLRIYRHRKRYSPRARFATWLFTIANNLALNALRNRKRRPAQPLEITESGSLCHEPQQLPPNANSSSCLPVKRLHQEELAVVIQRALETLNERQRLAIILNKYEDMNYADIAQVMGLTTKAVKSLLSRARARLREALQGYIDIEDGSMPSSSPDDSAVSPANP